jgi:hypothetical protein
MITNVSDFEQSTAFERYALEEAVPLLDPTVERSSVYDLRTGHAGSAMRSGGEAVARKVAALRPLFFGAAWKVIDLLVELALAQGSFRPDQHSGTAWSIKRKCRHARAGDGLCKPFDTDSDVWRRIGAVYAATSEARHCLVHRRFAVGTDGELAQLVTMTGQSCSDITRVEQLAFCRMAQRIANAVIGGAIDARERGDLCWQLDQLDRHHAMGGLGGDFVRPVHLLVANASLGGSTWSINVDDLKCAATGMWAGWRWFDLELHFPGTAHPPLSGRLDEMPGGHHEIAPAAPPSWLRR